MEKIKLGEYIRTIDGYIRKVTQVNEKGSYECLCCGAYLVDEKYKNSVGISAKKAKNHSFDIIDLIEVGDYVNGCKVYENRETYLMVYQKVRDSEVDYNYINHDDIKSIVTKEQFENIEYKVGE